MNRMARYFASAFFCLLLIAPATAQTVDTIDPGLRSQIDRLAEQVLKQTGVPSASVAVVQHGKLVYTHAYGKARLAAAHARDAGDALLHRLDFEAIHGRRHPDAATGRQALPR